jgi:hypothetical protein
MNFLKGRVPGISCVRCIIAIKREFDEIEGVIREINRPAALSGAGPEDPPPVEQR